MYRVVNGFTTILDRLISDYIIQSTLHCKDKQFDHTHFGVLTEYQFTHFIIIILIRCLQRMFISQLKIEILQQS